MSLEMKILLRSKSWPFWCWILPAAFLATGSLGLAGNTGQCSSEFSHPAGSVLAAAPEVSVRTELERLQKKNGLTIAIFNREGIGVLRFRKRSFSYRKLSVDWDFYVGEISPDGTKIALTDPLRNPGSLVVVRTDGGDLSRYDEFLHSIPLCWSHDNSSLVLYSPGPKLQVLELKSRLVQDIPIEDLSNQVWATSQCWSPDGKQIAYQSMNGNVFVYDLGERTSTRIAKGTGATWSPDGAWITYRDGDTYYAVHSNGEGRKKLFHKTRAVSALYWSPDSRFVAYVHEDFLAVDVEFYHLRIRRLEDGSEESVAHGGPVGAGDQFQWVTNPQLL
jgi:Tol biopolymer transport system component